jgi:hypothetical protein
VTYLSKAGGATVILDMPGSHYPTTPGGAVDCPLRKCVISRPEVGKHITFDGLALHGAPGDLFEKETDSSTGSEEGGDDDDDEEEEGEEDTRQHRVTFLVNIWLNHIPTQAEPLHEDLAADMQEPLTAAAAAPPSYSAAPQCRPVTFGTYPDTSVQTISLEDEAETETHAARWSLQVEDEDCEIRLRLPLAPRLEVPFAAGAHTVVVEQRRGGDSAVRSKASSSSSGSSSSSSGNGSGSSGNSCGDTHQSQGVGKEDGGDDEQVHKKHRPA